MSGGTGPNGNLRYEARCIPGVNRIEVQVAAPKPPRKEPVAADATSSTPAEPNGDSAVDGEHKDEPQQPQPQTRKSTSQVPELELEKVSLFVHVMRS